MSTFTIFRPTALLTCLLCFLLLSNIAHARPALNSAPTSGLLNNFPTASSIAANSILPITLLSFTAKAETGYNELQWKIIREVDLREFAIEYSTDDITWTKAGAVIQQPENVNQEYSFKHPTAIDGMMFYRLRMTDKNGVYSYSNSISIDTDPRKGNELMLFPAVNAYGPLQVQLNEPFNNLQVFNMNGQALMTQNLQNQTGIIRLNVSGFSKGMYAVIASRMDKKVSKIFMVQ
jgi:Secretion system C-terminal sorting domain